MSLLKCFTCGNERDGKVEFLLDDVDGDEERVNSAEDASVVNDEMQVVYLTSATPNENIIRKLESLTGSNVQTFTVASDCISGINTAIKKVFLIVDGYPPAAFLESIASLQQIDSIFMFSSAADPTVDAHRQQQHPHAVHWCDDEEALLHRIKTSSDELHRQAEAFTMYNQNQKALRDLSKGSGSYLSFNLLKKVLKSMPVTSEAKMNMITTLKSYYRDDPVELSNIDAFEKTYKSADAIVWFLNDTFVHKLINTALRTENVDVLYQFRFYILDLSAQLEEKFLKLKGEQSGTLKLYHPLELTGEDFANVDKKIGNLISPNGYLLTTNKRAVAQDAVKKYVRKEGVVRAVFEYDIDLSAVQTIILADVQQYSPNPEEAPFIIDIGASFQIDDCQFNTEEDVWYVKLHATDQASALAADYLEYEEKRLAESNVVIMFGHLLIDMGEYAKAERYFDTILNSSNPNDEETACIYFNFGRLYKLKGEPNRAINCYNRAYRMHLNARPKRLASAGKALNSLGVIYSEQGKQLRAEACFEQALKIFKKSISKRHADVGGVLINLGAIDCDRQNYDDAATKFAKAKKIYNRALPPSHPNQALPLVNLGNVHLATDDYASALQEYESALQIQQFVLPKHHPDIVRTLHNIAVVKAHQGNNQEAKEYLDRAEEMIDQTLPETHPLRKTLAESKRILADDIQ